MAVGWVLGVAVAEAVGVALGGTGVALGRTGVGAARPFVWVGLGCALGVGVGAAHAADGTAPSTAAAKAANTIRSRRKRVGDGKQEMGPMARRAQSGLPKSFS